MKEKIRSKLIIFLMTLSFILPITPSISANAMSQDKTNIIYTGSEIAKSLPDLGWYPHNGGYAWNKYGKNKNEAGILGKIYVLNGVGGNDTILVLQGYSSNYKSEIINTIKLFVPTQYSYLYNYIERSSDINEITINIDGREITLKVNNNESMTIYFGGVDITNRLAIDNKSN